MTYTVLKVTARLKQYLEQTLRRIDSDGKLYAELSRWAHSSNKETISFDLLLKVHQETDQSGYLHELLMESCLSLPEYVPPPRSAALEAHLSRLRAQAEERDYQRMVKNVDQQGSRDRALEFGLDVSNMNRQLWTVLNFLLTVIGAFVFGFSAAYFADFDTVMCVFVGLLFGIVVFLADLYFLVRSPGLTHKKKQS